MRIRKDIYSKDEVEQMEYLKKYSKEYVVNQNSDLTWEIVCNFGKSAQSSICVYNFPLNSLGGSNTLMFSYLTDFKSKSPIFMCKKLKSIGIWYEASLTDGECIILFLEKNLKDVEKIFRIRKRKRLTSKQRKIIGNRLREVRYKKEDENGT